MTHPPGPPVPAGLARFERVGPVPPRVRPVPAAPDPAGHAHAHGPAPAPAARAAPLPFARGAPLLALVVLVPAGALALAFLAPGAQLIGLPLAALGLAMAAASADLVGGFFTVTGRRLADPRYMIAFSSGIVIAAVFFELLPHAFEAQEGVAAAWAPDQLALIMAAGFFAFYLTEKLTMLHACGERECTSHNIGPIAVTGMALDNVVDGIGIAAGFLLDPVLGVIITLAVMAHEIPQGIASAELLARAGYRPRRVLATLAVAGSTYILGALISGFLPEAGHQAAIAFVAGSFIYVGASDLLAEAHRTFNVRIVGLVVLGAVVMYGLTALETLQGAH